MRSDIRAFRRAARVWLPAWRQLRKAFYRYQKLSPDLPNPKRFHRIDRYIQKVEANYAALDRTSSLVRQRERYRADVIAFSLAIAQRCPTATSSEARALLQTMSDAIQRFEHRLYRDGREP